jgi:hypothetical protein
MKKSAQAVCVGLLLSKALTFPVVAQTTDTETGTPRLSSPSQAENLKVLPRIGAGFTTTGAGYQEPYFSLEGFAPIQQTPGSDLTFLEGRLLFLTDSTIGTNLILGKRFYSPSRNRILGGYISYDVRDTNNNLFHQIGAGFERLGDDWDLRVNAYLPVGNTREQTSESLSNPFFQRNFLVLNRTRQFEAAMGGFDVEAGGRMLRLGDGDLRGYAGVYYLAAEGSDSGFGVRGRLEARPTDTMRLGLSVQHDPIFDTRVVFSLGVNFPGTRPRGVSKSSVLARLGESVTRTSTITVDEQTKNDTVTATNPETGQPWRFRHVNPGRGMGEGTFENPTGTVQDALNVAQPDDIVYVQAGTNPGIPAFEIPDGVAVLSVAPPQTIDTVEFSRLRLPLSGSGEYPEVRGTVTMGNDTTLSGFAITDVTGSAIQGTSIRNVTIGDNRITNPSEQGINLINVAGTSAIANNTITNSGSEGIFVQASGATQQDLTATNNTISGSGKAGIFVQGAENARAKLTANGNQVSGSTGQGIFAQASGTTQQELNISNSSVTNTSRGSDGTGGQGVFVQVAENAQQQFTANNNTVSDSAGQGIFVQASGTSQQGVTAKDNTVSNSAGQGIFAQASGTTRQQLSIDNNTVNSTNRGSDGTGGQGIFVQAAENTQQQLTANNNTVSNSAGQGIFVQASGGTQNFTAKGNTVTNSTGQGVFVQASGTAKQEFTLENDTVNGTNRGSDGTGGGGIFVQVAENAQQEFTLNDSRVSDSAGQGVFVQASGGTQSFTANNNTVSNSAGQGVFVQASGTAKQDFAIANTTVNGTNLGSDGAGGQGIFVQSSGNTQQQFTLDNNTVNSSAGQGIFVQASGGSQTFTVNRNTVSNSASQGIFVQASGTTQQEFAIANSTVSFSGGQGIFIQTAEDAQQKFSLNNNTIANSALEGIFIQTSNNAQTTANVQFNILRDNNTPGLAAFMNSTRNFCVGLNANNSNTNFLLQRNAGTFQVVNRDNVNANNTGTVNFVPAIGDFTDVPACP